MIRIEEKLCSLSDGDFGLEQVHFEYVSTHT